MVAIPVYIKHNIMYREGSGGRFDVTIGPKQTMGKTVSTHVPDDKYYLTVSPLYKLNIPLFKDFLYPTNEV